MKRYHIGVIVLIFINLVNAQNPFIQIDTRSIEQDLDRFARNQRIVSISFSMFHGQDFVFNYANGYADLNKKVKSTPEHLFPMASVTKTLTGAALMRAVRDSLISLSEPASNYINDFPSDVTIHELMTHQSGFRRNKNYGALEESDYRNIVDYIPRHRSRRPFKYTNINYAALGLVLESVYAKPYEEIVNEMLQTEINSGLQIHFTDTYQDDSLSVRVKNYLKRGWRRYYHKTYNAGLWKPAALALTSAPTMAAFLRHQMNADFIAAMTDSMAFVKYRWYAKQNSLKEYYGAGFRVLKRNNEIVAIYHNGFMYGTLSTIYYMPKYDIGFVAVSNTSAYPRQNFSFSSVIRRAVRRAIKPIKLADFVLPVDKTDPSVTTD